MMAYIWTFVGGFVAGVIVLFAIGRNNPTLADKMFKVSDKIIDATSLND